jgi:hypothetical protein
MSSHGLVKRLQNPMCLRVCIQISAKPIWALRGTLFVSGFRHFSKFYFFSLIFLDACLFFTAHLVCRSDRPALTEVILNFCGTRRRVMTSLLIVRPVSRL